MSLIPTGSLNFPVVFLEARMLGQPTAQIISQLGISVDAPDCSVAVFTRASGVLLVAGVGSYCAYRICSNFLGRRFVWMLLDSARCDHLARADLRLLNPSHLDVVDEVDEDDEGDRNSESEWVSRVSESRPASEMSVSRLQRVRRSIRAKGLLGLHQARTPRSGVLRREGASVAGSSQRSISLRDHSASSAGSECSASLHIVWEGQQWDDEFAQAGPMTAVRRGGPPMERCEGETASVLLPGHSMGDLCSVFDDVLSMATRDEHFELQDDLGDEQFFEDDDELLNVTTTTDDRGFDSHDDAIKKCMTDSKYLYQSVVLGSEFGGSEAGSLASIQSSASNLRSLRRRLGRTANPHGLWDLAQEGASTSKATSGETSRDPMTDSGLSSGLRSEEGNSMSVSMATGKPSTASQLYDSALGADLWSDDERKEARSRQLRLKMRGRHRLVSGLSSVAAMSTTSLEWFDDGLPHEISEKNADDSAFDGEMRVAVNGLDLDFESLRSSPDDRGAPSNSPSTRLKSPVR